MDYVAYVIRSRNGDLAAYGQLVARFQDMAFGYAYAQLGDFHLAQDVAQEAFLEGFRSIRSLREPAAWPAWLRRLVFKHCDRITRRKQPPTVALEAAADVPSPEKGPDEALEEAELKALVTVALRGLPEDERAVLTLFHIGDHAQREVAAFLGISVDTVKNRLRSGRRKLKERMLQMAKDTLHENAPSRDDGFVSVVGICNAAQAGELERVRQIIVARPELASQDLAANNENQAIHFAAREGHAEIVRVLLGAGADPLKGVYPHRDATSALVLARDRGHVHVVDVIERWLGERRGTTPLGEQLAGAIREGQRERALAMLDEAPSLVNAADAEGKTPLFAAIALCDPSLVLELLNRGAEVDRRDAHGRCPIYYCLNHSWKVPDHQYHTYAFLTGLLISRGVEYDFWVASAVGDADGVQQMLQTHEDPAVLFRSEAPFWLDATNPLQVACFHGHLEVVRLLLDAGADPDAPFEIEVAGEKVAQWGWPLWIAANRDHYGVAELLLERGANPDVAVYASGSAVSQALQHGHMRTANLLFGYGAVADSLDYCLTNNLAAVAEIFRSNPEERDRLLWSAVLAGNVEVVQMCLRRKPEYREERWFDILEQTVRGWRLGNLKINNEGWDRRDAIAILSMLLDYGVDPNLRNHHDLRADFTILHHLAAKACNPVIYGHTEEEVVEFARLFVDHGADVNTTESTLKSTPLGWAARYGHLELVAFLLERGADPNMAEEPWATPLAWAVRYGHAEIAEVLRQHGAR